jgi:pyruvate dehydrogenase E1 component alpha subunit
MPGMRLDGNNVVEVFKAAQKAVENARNGNGPSLLECMTYRWRGHVGHNYDLDKGLRSRKELEHWMDRCPIKTFEQQLLEQGMINELEMKKIHGDVDREVEEALIFARESPFPDPDTDDTLNVFKGHI